MAAKRRTKRHFRREDPIAELCVAGEEGRGFGRCHVEREGERSENVENWKFGMNERQRAAIKECSPERQAEGAGRGILMRRAGRTSVVMVRRQWHKAVTRRMVGFAESDARAMRAAEHLRRQPQQKRRRREGAELRTQCGLA